MYKVTIEDESGFKYEYTDVFNYAVITKGDLDYFTADVKEDAELSESEVKEVQRRLDNFENFPSPDEVRSVVKDVINERYGE